MADPRPLLRKEFARFLPDHRAIRAFEKLFDLIPDNLIELQEEIEKLKFDVFVVTQDHTTGKNEVVVCNNVDPISVTLNPSPEVGERAIVKRRGALVTIVGTIDGEADVVLEAMREALQLVYTKPGDWSKI
jgi:hypothetical protein